METVKLRPLVYVFVLLIFLMVASLGLLKSNYDYFNSFKTYENLEPIVLEELTTDDINLTIIQKGSDIYLEALNKSELPLIVSLKPENTYINDVMKLATNFDNRTLLQEETLEVRVDFYNTVKGHFHTKEIFLNEGDNLGIDLDILNCQGQLIDNHILEFEVQ